MMQCLRTGKWKQRKKDRKPSWKAMKEEEKFAKTNRPGQRNLRDQDASCSPSVSHAATRYNTLKLYELIKISKDLSPRKFFEVNLSPRK